MTDEIVMASVTLKSKSGLSLSKDFDKFSLNTIDKFRPKQENVKSVAKQLTSAGFKIEAQTQVGISFSGPKSLFESEFGVKIRKKQISRKSLGAGEGKTSFFKASQESLMSTRIAEYAESVQLASPGILFHNQNAPTPNPNYYHLDLLNDLPTLLNATAVHNAGITGAGIRISMIDTGFITRVTEIHNSNTKLQVTVDHTIRHVKGVWNATDTNHTGPNFFSGGSFSGTTITLGSPLLAANVSVAAAYSTLHPHYLGQNYNIDDVRAVGGLDVNNDEYGHGTAEAANALAIAPGATFSFVKIGPNVNYPLAGFQAAVQHQNPNVITCSWGATGSDRNALLLEIGNAVANGIVVIFAAGNGHTETSGVLAHPNLISAGGAYPIQGGGFRASNYASSFESVEYTNPQRHVPDIVGLCGETPSACLIMLPTQSGDTMDVDLSTQAFPNGDNTASNDGWVVCSGTSACAPQTAGVAALLLQRYPGITPMAVKNILENSARDIQSGSSSVYSGGDVAALGWDAATGFGLIDANAATNYLQVNKFNPYIRDSVMDNGTEPVVADRLCASPDVIVRSELVDNPLDELGQTSKHQDDLSDLVEDGQDNYIYLRVQNRGTLKGSCTAAVYFTDPGMLPNPTHWKKINNTALDIPDLEPGEFRVVGPIIWPDNLIPGTGHYCLISILDSPSDPAPDLASVHDWPDFFNLVGGKNNVAWKNIDIVDVIPGGSSSYSLYLDGLQGTGHKANLEVDLTAFPALATVMVKVLTRLAGTATKDNMQVVQTVPPSLLYTTLKHLGGIGALKNMPFKSNEHTKITIYISMPKIVPNGTYNIVTNLYIDGTKVNSYTQVVNVNNFAFVGNRRSTEIHRRECPWVMEMSPYNKIPMSSLNEAHNRGFDNCAYCLGGSKR